jgi:hypothetical protein
MSDTSNVITLPNGYEIPLPQNIVGEILGDPYRNYATIIGSIYFANQVAILLLGKPIISVGK